MLAADLFAGAGGMSLGLEQAGMNIVLGRIMTQRHLRHTGTTFPGSPLTGISGTPVRSSE